MNGYLLLRNNKEMGPFSLEDLITEGLKPYDLIWIQGRSAAWRYPSEIEELKAYAPILEEQPYDRFYKKSTDSADSSKKQTEKSAEAAIASAEARPANLATHTPVYISRPEKNQGAALMNELKKKESDQSKTVVPDSTSISEKWAHPSSRSAEKVSIPDEAAGESSADRLDAAPSLERRYSKPLDEIKEMYVQTLQERKKRISRKGDWQRRVKQFAPLVLLLGTGIIIGLLINKNPEEQTAHTPAFSNVDPNANNSIINTATREITAVPEESVPGAETLHADNAEAVLGYEGAYTDSVARALANQNRSGRQTMQKPSKSQDGTAVDLQPTKRSAEPEAAPDYDGTEKSIVSNPGGERNRRVREENGSNTASNSGADVQSLSELLKKVSVSSNEYVRGAFGGIKNLEITVRNNTRYSLDKVYVELQYMKPSEQPLKTEMIEFSSVAPRGSSTLKIPDSQRGIRVEVKIKRVSSQQLTDALAGL